jgi:hypothetical protein
MARMTPFHALLGDKIAADYDWDRRDLLHAGRPTLPNFRADAEDWRRNPLVALAIRRALLASRVDKLPSRALRAMATSLAPQKTTCNCCAP